MLCHMNVKMNLNVFTDGKNPQYFVNRLIWECLSNLWANMKMRKLVPVHMTANDITYCVQHFQPE